MLEAGVASPADFEIGDAAAENWRALARLSEEQFVAKIERTARHAVAALAAPRDSVPRDKMAFSPWHVDELGIKSRTVTAIEES